MIKKLRMSVMFVLVTTIFLAACGSDPGNETGEGTSGGDEQIEIRFAWWGDTGRHEIYNAIADLFEEANPDVRVIREPSSWTDYWTRLSTQSAGGNAPTIFGMHPQFASDYALRGVLADLEPFIEDGTIDTSYIAEAVVENGRVGENLYMVSQGVTTQAFGVNRTLLDRFGIEAPGRNEDWTWEEFTQLAKEFTDAVRAEGESYFFSFDHSAAWICFRWMARQFGGDTFTEDGALGFEEEALIRWFSFWNELRDYGAIPDPATVTEDGQNSLEQRLFTLGNIALLNIPANQLALYQAQSDEIQFDMLRVPIASDQVQRAEYIEGAFFAVSANATEREQEAAARLINFFINTEESLDIFQMEQGVPANQRLSEHIKDGLSEPALITIEFVNEIMEFAENAVYPPVGASEIDTLFSNVGERVMHGLLTPEEAASTFMEEATRILERD